MPENLGFLLPFKYALPVVLLALLWLWETWHPLFGWRGGRWRHALRNLSLALFNTLVLALVFGTTTVFVANWTTHSEFGLLNLIHVNAAVRFILALLFLDAWMYVWHRANHTIPLLWRFHRTHHSDNHMDVTTATRFHLGEHVAGATLRLGLIPLLGLSVWHIVVYDMLVIATIQFHHANISLGHFDRWLRMLIVTPDMHKVHHSRWQKETDSNYSTVLSLWDRLACTLRIRSNAKSIAFGVEGFDDARWQTLWGMLKTPFQSSGAKGVGSLFSPTRLRQIDLSDSAKKDSRPLSARTG